MPDEIRRDPIRFVVSSGQCLPSSCSNEPVFLRGSRIGQIRISGSREGSGEGREMDGLTGVQRNCDEIVPPVFDGCHEVFCLATSKSNGVTDYEGGSDDLQEPGAFTSGTELSQPDLDLSHSLDHHEMGDIFSYWESTIG